MQFRSASTPNSVLAGGFVGGAGVEQLAEVAFNPTCMVTASSGACRFLTCNSPATYDSAGTITVSVEGATIGTLLPIVGGGYTQFADGIVAQPGGGITVSASGEIVPAFSGSVAAPGALAATIPASVPRTAPLTITWTTSAPADRMQLVLVTVGGTIACTIESAAETLTVASELLGMLPAVGSAPLSLTASNQQLVTAGNYAVLLSAGDAISGTVSVE